MGKRKSIHDLAKELKVSTTTISYVLNGKARKKRVSKLLEERISKYVKKQDINKVWLPKHTLCA